MGKWTNDYILVAIPIRLVAIRITDPDCDTGKTCLGGGMHCPSASIFYCVHTTGERDEVPGYHMYLQTPSSVGHTGKFIISAFKDSMPRPLLVGCSIYKGLHSQTVFYLIMVIIVVIIVVIVEYKNSSGDEIANVNFYAVRPERYANSLK